MMTALHVSAPSPQVRALIAVKLIPLRDTSLRTVIGATYALHICKQSDHMEDVKKAPHLISYQVPRTTVTVRKAYRQSGGVLVMGMIRWQDRKPLPICL